MLSKRGVFDIRFYFLKKLRQLHSLQTEITAIDYKRIA